MAYWEQCEQWWPPLNERQRTWYEKAVDWVLESVGAAIGFVHDLWFWR